MTPSKRSAEQNGYRFLAAILASYLGASVEDSSAATEQAGRAWGGFVVDKPAPFSKLDPDEAIQRLVAMLDEFGFSPELDQQDPDAQRLLLRRCPFLDVAREHQDVVCAVHLGLMRGALDEFGVDVQARDLIPLGSTRCMCRPPARGCSQRMKPTNRTVEETHRSRRSTEAVGVLG